MPRVVKFALRINDEYIDTLDDLKNNFDIEKVIGYFNDGRLLRWLKVHSYEEEAAKVESIGLGDEKLPSRLYEIFCIEPPANLNLDVEETVKRHNRLERLKTYTNDPKILSKVDSVAFNQNELDDLIKNGVAEIYLCSGEFVIPLDVRDKTYIGIEKVVAIIESEFPVDFEKLNVQFRNISFDANYEKIPRTTDKMYEFAKSYYDKQNFEKAFEWYKKAADNGNTDAMNALGYCYEYGKGVKQNSEKAFEWYKKAADNFNTTAMNNVGHCYEYGKGVKQNFEKAFEWYKKAADNGNIDAMNALGYCYEYGKGVKQNFEKAFEWYKKAADNFNTTAMINLGDCYEYGKGVKQNFEKALEWYKKAADNGNTDAPKKILEITKQLRRF